jgi:hypothetical protein
VHVHTQSHALISRRHGDRSLLGNVSPCVLVPLGLNKIHTRVSSARGKIWGAVISMRCASWRPSSLLAFVHDSDTVGWRNGGAYVVEHWGCVVAWLRGCVVAWLRGCVGGSEVTYLGPCQVRTVDDVGHSVLQAGDAV